MIPVARPIQCTIELTELCHLHCRHCYRCSTHQNRAELPKQRWLKFLDELARIGVLDVLFEGGEPFLHPDFLEILSAATDRFITRISTSGSLIDNNTASLLKQIGVGSMFVFLYGPNREIHDSITGVCGSFDRTLSGIESLIRHNVRTVMVNIPMKPNIARLADYIRLAEAMHVRNVSLIGLYRLGRAKAEWDALACQPDELYAALATVRSTPRVFVDHRYYPHIHNCCSQACTVTSTGQSIGCSYLREVCNYGNIQDLSLLEMWNSAAWRQVRYGKVGGKCVRCELYKGSCGGGCRAAALQNGGGFFDPDPLCSKIIRTS
jgi:radical SAM protein with 4Fe4S-binding SPASM domain